VYAGCLVARDDAVDDAKPTTVPTTFLAPGPGTSAALTDAAELGSEVNSAWIPIQPTTQTMPRAVTAAAPRIMFLAVRMSASQGVTRVVASWLNVRPRL